MRHSRAGYSVATWDNVSLHAKNLTCGYRDVVVLRDVQFEFQPGEICALLGPNGSGKSTLMKTLAGAIHPLGGHVELCGDNITVLSSGEIAKRIGYVPQSEAPAFDFTVREIVAMGRIPHSEGLFETKDDISAASEALIQADCVGIESRPMSQLSGGEAQRARIARALAQNAPILLMDEPTTHLDISHQLDIGRLITSLANSGRAIVVAVHDLNWASMFCTRAAVFHQHKLACVGPVQDVLRNPLIDEAFAAKFERIDNGSVRVFASKEQG